MTTPKFESLRALLLLLICWTISFSSAKAAASDNPILIAHRNTTVETLTFSEVKEIFLGEKSRWPNNQRIRFVILKSGETHDVFLKNYVGKTSSQYMIHWKKMVFSGRGRMPDSVDTPAAVLNFVQSTPGAVGYVPEGVPLKAVKVLRLQ